jgi:hypothetical protein
LERHKYEEYGDYDFMGWKKKSTCFLASRMSTMVFFYFISGKHNVK